MVSFIVRASWTVLNIMSSAHLSSISWCIIYLWKKFWSAWRNALPPKRFCQSVVSVGIMFISMRPVHVFVFFPSLIISISFISHARTVVSIAYIMYSVGFLLLLNSTSYSEPSLLFFALLTSSSTM